MMQFKLGRLLLGITGLCVLVAVTTQLGTATAEFVVVRNELQQEQTGTIGGVLWCNYVGPGQAPEDPRPFRFEIRGVTNGQLLQLQPGQTDRIRFRFQPFWPLKKEDPFKRYIEHSLGINGDAIVGYVMTDAETNVMINGRTGPAGQ